MSEKSLGERIKEARKEREWSRGKLADKLGISERTILRWELKGDFPNYENQEGLIKHLGFQKEDFQQELQAQAPVESISPMEPSDLEHLLPPKDYFKLYCGRRIYKRQGNGRVSKNTYVTVNGRRLKYFGPGKRNPEEENVFEWGYNGAGPRALAEAILADYLKENYPEQEYPSQRNYNALLYASYFKEDIIGKLPRHTDDDRDDSWQISSNRIRNWFYTLEEEEITREILLEDVFG